MMNKKQKDLLGIKLLTLSGIVVVIFVGFYLMQTNKSYNKLTLCPESGETQRVAIILDKSDYIDNLQSYRRVILDYIDNGKLKIHGRLLVFIVNNNGSSAVKPVFELCNPGRGDQVSRIYKNPRMVEKYYLKKFSSPLDEILEVVLKQGESSTSPITQTLSNVVKYDNIDGRVKDHEVVIISDMFENSSLGTSYGDRADLDYGVFNQIFPKYNVGSTGNDNVRVILQVVKRSNRTRQSWVVSKYWVKGLTSIGVRVEVKGFE